MKRAWLLVAVAILIGVFSGQRSCAQEPAFALPPAADGWTLTPPQTCHKPVPAEYKTWRGTQGAHRVCRGEYVGSPAMKLTIYDMPNEFASAFDAAQKWQPQPGKMGFFKGRYFGVVESPDADRRTIERFLLAVEATLPAGSEWHH
jgi:hypothetical protein